MCITPVPRTGQRDGRHRDHGRGHRRHRPVDPAAKRACRAGRHRRENHHPPPAKAPVFSPRRKPPLFPHPSRRRAGSPYLGRRHRLPEKTGLTSYRTTLEISDHYTPLSDITPNQKITTETIDCRILNHFKK